jgi:hypothetical protein
MESIRINEKINNITETINKLQNDIESINTRINIIEQNFEKFKEDIINEMNQTAIPLINSTIDASKPELRNFIIMIIKEEFRLRS